METAADKENKSIMVLDNQTSTKEQRAATS